MKKKAGKQLQVSAAAALVLKNGAEVHLIMHARKFDFTIGSQS